MRKPIFALADQSPEQIQKEEQELREILKESDRKAKELLERLEPRRSETADTSSARIARKKKEG